MPTISQLKENPYLFKTPEHLISKGTTRAVYGVGEYVIKFNLHWIGHVQSKNEERLFRCAPIACQKHLAVPYDVTDEFAIFQRVTPYCTTYENYGWLNTDLDDWTPNEARYHVIQAANTPSAKACADFLLNHNVMDIDQAQNVGYDDDSHAFVFLDYGMTTALFKEFSQCEQRGEIIVQDENDA